MQTIMMNKMMVQRSLRRVKSSATFIMIFLERMLMSSRDSTALSALRSVEAPRQTRTDVAAARLVRLAEATEPGQRLGSKEELRRACGVSVGTFNEAIRLAQARGLVTVRPGPGGGLFAALQSPMVRLGNSVLALDADATSVADAVRIRDALDPLLIEDALRHASPAHVDHMRDQVTHMEQAVNADDPTAFIRANWALHALIASVSPSAILRSVYTSLLALIETHTLSVQPVSEQALPDYIAERLRLHRDLVEAIAVRDRVAAQRLIQEHNTTDPTQSGEN
ncbi:MAG: FCD domain-containing protein [Actinomycetota bacterium]|nr:FCD domain-containing protein [Actinomycetota bacterium]